MESSFWTVNNQINLVKSFCADWVARKIKKWPWEFRLWIEMQKRRTHDELVALCEFLKCMIKCSVVVYVPLMCNLCTTLTKNHQYLWIKLHLEMKFSKKVSSNVIIRPVEMKKILGGGGYKIWNIVSHHGWPTKKIFDFKSSKRARKI